MTQASTHDEMETQRGLYQMARVLQCLDYPHLLQTALDTLGQITGAQHGLLTLIDADFNVEQACHLSYTDATLPWQALIELGLAGYVLHSRRTVVIHNLARDPRWPHNEGLPRRGSACGVPLLYHGQVFGLFLLIHERVDYFNQMRTAFLEASADLTAQAILNAREYSALRQQADLRDGLVIVPAVGDPGALEADDEQARLREALTAMVYHDLRNPLQTIRLSLQKLTQLLANHENPAVLTLLQTGTRGTRQLKRMVDSLLDIQRIEAGDSTLNRRETDLRVLLAEAVQLVQPLAQDAGLRLRFGLADDLPVLKVDDDMVLRVVTNLLENAVKYTPEGGQVTLQASVVDGERALICVQDTGPGIPPEFLNTIFEKYTRVKTQDAPRGVGLGLAFCQMAVEAHGGSIWAESQPGQGATFRFTLPLMPTTTDETTPVTPVAAV